MICFSFLIWTNIFRAAASQPIREYLSIEFRAIQKSCSVRLQLHQQKDVDY